jgi:hypothetical protein
LRNSTVADVFTEGFSLTRRNIERSMRVLECQGTRPAVIFGGPRGVLRTLAVQGMERCKALVGGSRMSYYELSEIEKCAT